MITKCVVACHNAFGEPDLFFVKISCNDIQYDNGQHYDAAKKAAANEGYEGPYVVFDDNDGPNFLFEHFVWESASTLKVQRS